MAAVGMLAPIMESLLVAIFEGLKSRVDLPEGHRRRTLPGKDVWNPQVYAGSKGGRRDLLLGAQQLVEAIGLTPFLPQNFKPTLEALIAYRNNMFHNGFEWPRCPHSPRCEEPCKEDLVSKFEQQIRGHEWPNHWFEMAERNGKPWLYYMSPDFCAHCIELIDGIINGVGRYLKERGV